MSNEKSTGTDIANVVSDRLAALSKGIKTRATAADNLAAAELPGGREVDMSDFPTVLKAYLYGNENPFIHRLIDNVKDEGTDIKELFKRLIGKEASAEYIEGFLTKCAEVGVDPEELLNALK